MRAVRGTRGLAQASPTPADVVDGRVRVVLEPSLEGPARVVVLDAVGREALHFAVVHRHQQLHRQLPEEGTVRCVRCRGVGNLARSSPVGIQDRLLHACRQVKLVECLNRIVSFVG